MPSVPVSAPAKKRKWPWILGGLVGVMLIGCIGAHKNGDALEVGYWFGRPYWGAGYATEALKAFIAEAKSLGRLEAGHERRRRIPNRSHD